MQTPEEFVRHLADTEDGTLDPATEVWAADLIRARDAEVAEQVRASDPVLRAWVDPGPNPPYRERMKARVRKIMPVLARHLDEKAKGIR